MEQTDSCQSGEELKGWINESKGLKHKNGEKDECELCSGKQWAIITPLRDNPGSELLQWSTLPSLSLGLHLGQKVFKTRNDYSYSLFCISLMYLIVFKHIVGLYFNIFDCDLEMLLGVSHMVNLLTDFNLFT